MPLVGQAQDGPQNDAFEQARAARSPNALKILRLIEQLGAAEFAKREAAREALREIGAEALPLLEQAQSDSDAERASAATGLVQELRWAVDPALRDVVGEALDAWPELPAQSRLQGVALLGQRAGSLGVPFLVRVARYDPEAPIRLAAIEAYFLAAPHATPHEATLLTALADEQPGPQVLWLESQLQLRSGDREAGLATAIAAAESDPQPPPQRLLTLVDLLLDEGRVDDARAHVDALVTRLPNDARVVLRQGELLARGGEVEEGLALLERVAQAVEEGKTSPRTLIRLGRAYLACGRGEAADLLYRKALGRNPYRHDLILARADLCRDRGLGDEALKLYLSEITYTAPGEPAYAELCQRLGDLLRERGAGVLEPAVFHDAQRGRPLRRARATVAAWLLEHGLQEEAVVELRLVNALQPTAGALRTLGDALRDLGDFAAARDAYTRALKLNPDNVALQGRLRSVEGPAPDVAAPDSSSAGGFRVWERRVPGDGKGVGDGAPPPLLLERRVIACLPGSTSLEGLEAANGEPVWRYTPTPPRGPEGALPEQLSWEVIGLFAVPAGAVAAEDPGRARQATPLVGALLNGYWRPLNRSWRKARFLGVSLHLLDPQDGRLLVTRELPDAEQILAVAPEPYGSQQLVLSAISSRRNACELVDAVLGRSRWRAKLGSRAVRAFGHHGQRLLVRHQAGLLALDPEGAVRWTWTGKDLSAGPVRSGARDLVGTREGKVLGFGSGETPELELSVGEGRVHGLSANAAGWYASVGQTTVRAFGPDDAPRWAREDLDRAAARELVACADAVFAISGMRDAYDTEVPSLLGLDPETGAEVLRRPLPRPCRWRANADSLALVAGSERSALVFCVYPGQTTDARTARLTALRLAAADALSEGQFEVSAVVARAFVAARGGYDVLGTEDLAFVARTLARSRRLDEAEDVLFFAEAQARTEEDLEPWTELREELGLAETYEDAPAEDPQDPAKSGADDPTPGPDTEGQDDAPEEGGQ